MAAAVSVYPGALSAPTQQREDEAAPLSPVRPLADLLTCPVSAVSDGCLLRAAPARAARPPGVGGAAAALRAQRPTPELGAARLGAVHQARHAALPGCARRRCVPTPDNTQSTHYDQQRHNHAIDTSKRSETSGSEALTERVTTELCCMVQVRRRVGFRARTRVWKVRALGSGWSRRSPPRTPPVPIPKPR